MMDFWSFGFILLFAISGIYLANPERVPHLAGRIEPITAAHARTRSVDQVIYGLAYLHVGRINGIGLPCSGSGLCDATTKLLGAVVGLAPPSMFVTGAMTWWNRGVRQPRSKERSTKA